MGIPVSFAEIDKVSIICEISEKIGEMVPDVSLGTHFFNNLVELDILYLVMHPEKENYFLNRDYFHNSKNSLEELLPDSARWADIVKVIDVNENNNLEVDINMNAYTQEGICYITKKQNY